MNRNVAASSAAQGSAAPTLSIGAQPYAQGTRFKVWAPGHKSVEVVLFGDDGSPGKAYQLKPTTEGYLGDYIPGIFSGDIAGVSPGDRYKYRIDGGGSFPDPASRSQPDGVHGASQVVDPAMFTWSDGDWHGVKLEDLVIYEVHVGTATQEGTFDALITHLGAIRDLGATAILLMAIADFPGDRNWGYDGVDLFAPARTYGGPEALRRLVNAAHSCYGLAVILDVVFNHLGPEGNYLSQFSESYFSKEHTTPWGQGIQFDGKAGRLAGELFVANGCYWALEYRVDGLRLDAINAIQDTAEPHIVRRIASKVCGMVTDRSFLVIAEDDNNDPALVRPTEEDGFGLGAVYADDFHHQMHVALTGERSGYYIDYTGTVEHLTKTMQQSWWFTGEQFSQWRKDGEGKPRLIGAPADDVPRQHFIWCLQNHDQVGNRPLGERLHQLDQVQPNAYRAASALLLLSPHTPLLFMGQEWGASTPFLYFTDHRDPAVAEGVTQGRLNRLEELFPGYDRGGIISPQDPRAFWNSKLRWRERNADPHAGILRLYKDLLKLRREHKALRPYVRDSFTAEPIGSKSPYTLALSWRGATAEDELLAIANLRGPLSLDLRKVFEGFRTAASGWVPLLDTEDPRYGGSGGTLLSNNTMLTMSGAGVILLGRVTDKQPSPRKGIQEGAEYDLFLSFSSSNQQEAEEIIQHAKQAGLRVFHSGMVNPGDTWEGTIQAALKSSRKLVLLATPESLLSEWVTTELGAAWGLEKQVIPILFGCKADALPERLRRHQAIDLHRFLRTDPRTL